ncbi:MAG TPA: two-component sensor histidine kinase, partial [Thauera sp.]|nr:two-component sensor histidine kinase [Thauera sp.]
MSLAERLRGSVRAKLLALVLAPLMLGFPLIMGLLWYWGEVYYHRLMVSRVASDLATAHGYFERVIDGVGSRVQALAGSHALAQSLAHETPEAVAALLGARKGGLALDFLNLLDVNGRVLHSSTAMAAGSARGDWSVVQRAIGARGGSVVERFAAAELAAIDVGLRERARLALVATPRARPDPRPEEERGLVVHAAAPVLDAAGNLVAVLEGGVLLNGN